MVSIITILYLLTGLLGVYAHALEDIDAVYAASDLPGQQVIYALESCDNGKEYDDEYEPIRKELIVNAATVVTRLTQYSPMWRNRCAGCSPPCPPPCPVGCCSMFNLSVHVAKDLEKLIGLWDKLDHGKMSVPLVTSTCGKKPESVIIWARTDIKVKDPRNMLSRSVLHGLGREGEMKEDREGLFVELDVEAGCGEDRKKYLAQRFEVKDHVDFEVSLGEDFVKVAGVLGMSEECLNWVPKGMKVLVPKEVSDVPREL